MTATFSKLLRNPSHLPSCQRSAAPPRPAEPSSGVGPLSSPPIDSATGGTPDHHKVKVIGWMACQATGPAATGVKVSAFYQPEFQFSTVMDYLLQSAWKER